MPITGAQHHLSPLARRLLWRLMLSGLGLSLLVSALVVLIDYQRVRERAIERFDQIQTSYLTSVVENVWLQDTERLDALILGIRNLPFVDAVEVLDENGKSLARRSRGLADDQLRQVYPLIRNYRDKSLTIGSLHVSVSLSDMRRPVIERAWLVVLANMLVICGASIIAYWLVKGLVTHPLGRVASYARTLAQADLTDPPSPPQDLITHTSEFSDVVNAFSDMRGAIRHSYGALQESESRFRTMFDSSPVSLWEEDFSLVKSRLDQMRGNFGGENEHFLQMLPSLSREMAALVRVIEVNEATLSLHRAPNRETLLGALDRTFTQESFSAFERQLIAIWLGEYEASHEATVKTLDGEVLSVVIHWYVPPAHRDAYDRVIVALDDITERKAMEQTLVSTVEKMAQANSELERFAFGASHDLQEPIRSIVSFSQLLSRRLEGRLQGDEAELLNFLIAAGQRMQQQVNGLHDYAAVTAIQQELGVVDMNHVLVSVLDEMRQSITERNAVITYDPLPMVYGDAHQLGDLLRHLLLNAITFTRPGVPPKVQISARPMDQFWCFSIQDNGIGIDPHYAGDVFQLFRRLHGPGHYPGAGIGLATSRRIIDRHGGSIWVAAHQQSGAKVCFTLPRPSNSSLSIPAF